MRELSGEFAAMNEDLRAGAGIFQGVMMLKIKANMIAKRVELVIENLWFWPDFTRYPHRIEPFPFGRVATL